MPKLKHNGPDGNGPLSGRKLGKCSNEDESNYKIGVGMGLQNNKESDCKSKGKGKRKNTYKHHI